MRSVFDSAYWNLIQALAWIYLADEELVAAAGDGDETSPTIARMTELPDGSHQLIEVQGSRLTALELATSDRNENRRLPSLSLAQKALIEALTAGTLEALGLENNRGDFQKIPQHYWLGARFYFEPEMAGPKEFLRIGASAWHQLRFPSAKVLSLWPAPIDLRAPLSETPNIAGENKCRKWLLAQMRSGPQDAPKKHYRELALSQFNVSKRGFNRAWANALQEAQPPLWGRPGRRPFK